MKSIYKVILIIISICLMSLITLSGCDIIDNLFNKDKDERVLTAYIEDNCYVGENCKLYAKWDDGEIAEDARFEVNGDFPVSITYEMDAIYVHPMNAGTITIVAIADNISSQPLKVTVQHTISSLQSLLDANLSNLEIDKNVDIGLEQDSGLSVSLSDLTIATLEDNILTFQGIGELDLIIKKSNGDIFLTYTTGTYDAFTLGILSELRRTGIIEAQTSRATTSDFERAKELSLPGLLYAFKGQEKLLTKFTNLEYLNIADCNLQSLSFLNSPSLSYLDASGNLISDISPIASYMNLKYLDLSDNMLSATDNDSNTIASLVNLKSLRLGGNNLSLDFIETATKHLSLDVIEIEEYISNTPSSLYDYDDVAIFNSVRDYMQEYINSNNIRTPNVIINLYKDESHSTPIKIIQDTLNIEIINHTSHTMYRYIDIEPRKDRLTMILQSLRLIAPTGHSAIEASNDSYIKLAIKGDIYLQGCGGKHGISGGFIEITAPKGIEHSLTCKGGAGLTGSNNSGSSSDSASSRQGGLGSEGGSGIVARIGIVIRQADDISLEGGKGGDGGDGGKYKFGPPSYKAFGKGGDGGTGGRGGCGYKCPLTCITINADFPNLKAGQGGRGGNGYNHVDPNYRGKPGKSGMEGDEFSTLIEFYY